MLWFLRIKNTVSKIIVLIRKSLSDFNEAFIPYNEPQFLDWPSIVAHSSTGLMHILYGITRMVHRKIQVIIIIINYIQLG